LVSHAREMNVLEESASEISMEHSARCRTQRNHFTERDGQIHEEEEGELSIRLGYEGG
jgi:hypothetical protein